MNMKDLEELFDTAIAGNYYIAVKISMIGLPEPEVILNPKDNLREKFEYYKRAYNDDLTLKTYSGIQIIDAVACGGHCPVEWFYIGYPGRLIGGNE